MTDWNPAEIIGNNPNSLDYSIYKYLIMRDSWEKGRHIIGYQKIKQKNLMIKFGNKPYVDIRKSFNSLIPKNLEKDHFRRVSSYNDLSKYLNLYLKFDDKKRENIKKSTYRLKNLFFEQPSKENKLKMLKL